MALRQRSSSTQTKPTAAPAPSGPPPYNWRATLWLLVGMLVVIGAMGVFMRVIPTPWTQPSPTVAPTVSPTQPAIATAPAIVAPTTAPVAAPTAAPPVATQTQPATVAPAIQPTVRPTSAPTAQPTNAAVIRPTAQATAASAVDPALEAEILVAYGRYSQIVDDAFATLDGSHLSEVMDGTQLVAARTYLEQLRSEGKAAVGPTDHSISVLSATSEDAVIHDRLIDHGVFVDPITREPLPSDQQASKPYTEIEATYYLRKVNGVWKVVGES